MRLRRVLRIFSQGLTAFLITGCGGYTFEVKETTATETTESTSTVEADREPEVGETSESVDGVSESVATETTESIEQETAPKWISEDRVRNFYSATTDAPDGYRLPTRVEVLAAWENKELENFEGNVWTTTETADRSDFVLIVNLSTSDTFGAWKSGAYETLYMRDDDEK